MREIITLVLILGYFITSIIVGIGQYQSLGDLSATYITTQWIVLGISTFCTFKFQNSDSIVGDTLATLGGGIAMMVIIQAVLFYVLGDVITANMGTFKIIILVIIGLIIIRIVFKHLTKGLR